MQESKGSCGVPELDGAVERGGGEKSRFRRRVGRGLGMGLEEEGRQGI